MSATATPAHGLTTVRPVSTPFTLPTAERLDGRTGGPRTADREADDTTVARLDASAPTADTATPTASLRRDVRRALRDASKLGSSLLGTWAIALGVRIYMPRFLGPAAFGGFQFADAFTTALFVLAGLGIETYTRKEIATRREHASDFFGGTLLLRLAISTILLVAAVAALHAAGKSDEVLRLVVILGVAQVLATVNTTYAAMLHAAGRVDGLSVWNVVSKLAWGAGIGIAFGCGWGVTGAAIAMLAAELLKTAALAVLAGRHLGLHFRVDVAASLAVLRASLPFFMGSVAQMIYGKVDVSIMSFLTSDTEVGWYGAAGTLAGMSMLLSPLIGWVLLPLTSRAAARSEDELMLVTRRSMETILSIAIPTSLFFYVAAEPVVALAFGAAYAPAVLALRLLAPTFVLTYSAIVSASILIRLERGWAVSWAMTSGLVLSPVLNLWLVPWGLRTFGPGGAGAGAAIALVVTETYTAGVMAWLIGRRGIDRRLGRVLARTLAVCALVLLVDRLLAPLGAWRLGIDAMLYVAGVIGSGAVDLRELTGVVRTMTRVRRGTPVVAEVSA